MYCIHFMRQVRRPVQIVVSGWSNFKICQTHHIELIRQWEAHQLPRADNGLDLVVTNMPWRRRISVGFGLQRLYRGSFSKMCKVLASGGRSVALTTAPELVTTFYVTQRGRFALFGHDHIFSWASHDTGLPGGSSAVVVYFLNRTLAYQHSSKVVRCVVASAACVTPHMSRVWHDTLTHVSR